jgi:hypothetical protein
VWPFDRYDPQRAGEVVMKQLFLSLFALFIMLASPALSVETNSMITLEAYFQKKGVSTVKELDDQSKYYFITRCSALYLSFSKLLARGGSHETPYSKFAVELLNFATMLDMKINTNRTIKEASSITGEFVSRNFTKYADIANDNYANTGSYTEGNKIFIVDQKLCPPLGN